MTPLEARACITGKDRFAGECLSQADQPQRNAHDAATQLQHVTIYIRPSLNANDRMRSAHTSNGPELPGLRISEISGAMRKVNRISQGPNAPECDWRCAGMNGERQAVVWWAVNEVLRTKSTRQ
jgi:hypothetical protein